MPTQAFPFRHPAALPFALPVTSSGTVKDSWQENASGISPSGWAETHDSGLGAGTWTVSRGVLVATSNSSFSVLRRTDFSATNTIAEARLSLATTNSAADYSGICSRIADDGTTYYVLAIRSGGYALAYHSGGSTTGIGSVSGLWTGGQIFTAALKVSGNRISAYFEGSQVLSVVDSTLVGPGRVGLQSNQGAAEPFYWFRAMRL